MSTIHSQLIQILSQLQTEWGIPEPILADFSIPTVREHGDYSTNIAMNIWAKRDLWPTTLRERFTQPRLLAEALAAELQQRASSNHILAVKVAGPGFLNVYLSDSYYYDLMHYESMEKTLIQLHLDNVGTAVVEYSSPNIAKPFTIGHLRSTIIGDAVANILAATGWAVHRDNHLGDWGTQFGKQIYALVHLGKGSLEANLAELEKAAQPVKYLVELYIEFHTKAETDPSLEDEARAWFKKLEDGDVEARKLWQLCIDFSWQEFERIYQKLSVTFTENNGRGYGESYFEDKMQVVVDALEQANKDGKLRYEKGKEDAKLVFFPADELPPLMIMKKDGATLYATRDLATDFFRLKQYGKDILVVNEVGAEQSLYFQQIYRIEQLLGWYTPDQRVHVKHGLYRFAAGKMSTRKGNVIWLEDVLNEAEKRAIALAEGKELPTQTASAVGIGALKWNDLKRSSHLDVTFDWDEILSMQGNSGPYVQYAYVRAANILRKAGEDVQDMASGTEQPVLSQVERQLAQAISEYPAAVAKAAREFAPHHLCTYLYELAQYFNSFYAAHQVLATDSVPAQRVFRLALVRDVHEILAHGLGLLGIQTVEEM